MANWTWETVAALKAADAAYTRAWLVAMRAFDLAPTLDEAREAYNLVMAAAVARWNQDSASAVALSEGAEF